MDLPVLKKSRATSKSKVTRLKKNILKEVEERVLESTVRNHLSELKLAWEGVQSLHEQYVNQLPEGEDEEEEQWISTAFDEYKSTEVFVQKYLFDIGKEQAKAIENEEQEAQRDAES